ncbi:MAG: GntR family transcriptional regulator [Hyphomicrobiaceae bacterium]|nr:GntR family transcriptional regulator [Hyphomicrobiaceae bacterium]
MAATRPDARPLYAQVRDALKQDIQEGAWKPGDMLPSEFELAAAYGVSQGTVRKALDALTREHVLVRRQGIGTFVSAHTPADVLFRFFQFRDTHGERVIPESRPIRTSLGKATRAERDKLGLTEGATVIRHVRIRLSGGHPFIYETIVLPEAIFPGLGAETALPNTLYDKFQSDYGVTVATAHEQLATAAAAGRAAASLGVPAGTPLLRIDRRTVALDGRVIEWRLSLCHLDGLHYAVDVG